MDGDLICWTASFLSDRTVEMVIEGKVMERHLVEAGISQGSPVSPIVFAIYTSGLIQWVEERVAGIEGLSFVDNVRWVAIGSDVNQVVRKLEACARQSIDWAERSELEFDTTKTEAALFTRRRCHLKHLRPKLTAKIRVGNGFIKFNKQATRWLGVWMDAHLMFKEHHNRCMKKARAAEARLRSLTGMYRVVPACVIAVQVACVQAVALYSSELWWDPKTGSGQDDLQLLLNRQARSTLGALPTTPRGALMRDSGLTPAAVALDARQQRFVARLASACEGSKSKKLYDYPTPGALVGRVAASEHTRGRRTETMCWPDSGVKPAVKTTILEDDAAAMRAVELWAREMEGKAESATWTWWTDGSCTDDGKVGAAAVCLNGDRGTVFRSYLGTRRMEVFDAELWAIAVALRMSVTRAEALQAHRVTTVGIFSDSQAAIRRTAHLDPGPGQQLARAINEHARALGTHGIEVVIHWVPGHLGIPGMRRLIAR